MHRGGLSAERRQGGRPERLRPDVVDGDDRAAGWDRLRAIARDDQRAVARGKREPQRKAARGGVERIRKAEALHVRR